MKRLSWHHIPKQPAKIAATVPRVASLVPTKDRLYAKLLAIEEGCSVRTARRLMSTGNLGAVHGRNARDRWIDRQAYQRWLDAKASSTAAESRFTKTL